MGRTGSLIAVLTLLVGGVGCDDSSDPSTSIGADSAGANDGGAADGGAADANVAGRALLESIPQSGGQVLPGLTAPVQVAIVEAGIPHIYAENRLDLARVQGFIVGRDRYFMIDLARRLAQGRLSALLGELVLDLDISSRAQGMTALGARLWDASSPVYQAEMEAFAEGINSYIEAVRAGELPAPTELVVTAPLLSVEVIDTMDPFTGRDIADFAATIVFQLGYSAVDLEHSLGLQEAMEAFADDPLRLAGVVDDIFERVKPLTDAVSVPLPKARRGAVGSAGRKKARENNRVPSAMLRSLNERLLNARRLMHIADSHERGSNAWAISGQRTASGNTLVAGDGHLDLTVPSFFVQMGLDTKLLGGGETGVAGLVIPGLPPLAVGTNGDVAWSFTYFYADVTDFYREELIIEDGLPTATRFEGGTRPLQKVVEEYEIANVPALRSVGRVAAIPRWMTFDGRMILSIEGRAVEDPDAGEITVNVGDGAIVPADMDGDGVITAISMDFTGLDAGDMIEQYDALSRASDVDSFREGHAKLVVFPNNFAVGDRHGNLFNSGYHASPCRAHLPRDGERFSPGADPSRLLDGTRFGAFEVRVTADGLIDESDDSASRCVVKHAEFPESVNPDRGYIFTANNDPNGNSLDDSLANDAIYIGGPWSLGLRGETIETTLAAAVARGDADVDTMTELQASSVSPMGQRFAPRLLQAIADAREAAQDGDGSLSAALYDADNDGFDAVEALMNTWAEGGYVARSGVKTFYDDPTEAERTEAVATMVFNAWFRAFGRAVFEDEALPNVDRIGHYQSLIRALVLLLDGRGDDNPMGLSSWDPQTGESAFFDDLRTPDVVERSDTLMVSALASALEGLRAAPDGAGLGGFGTDEMSEWLWGLRHLLQLNSIVSAFLTDQPALAGLLARFAIRPGPGRDLNGPEGGDADNSLPGWPRSGDNFNVDAAHVGLWDDDYFYQQGPVFRMVISLTPEGRVTGRNIVPGGQSGIQDSANYADQALLYLGNESLPFRFHIEDVVEGAVGREIYRPAE